MHRRLARFMLLALVLPAICVGRANGQVLPIPEVPDFTEMVNGPDDVIQVQAKQPALALTNSPNVGVPVFQKPAAKSPGYESLVSQALQSNDFADERYLVTSRPALELTRGEQMKHAYQEQVMRLFYDFRSFYGRDNLAHVGLAVVVAAPIANTRADRSIRNWYQDRVRPNSGLDSFADAGEQVGDFKFAIPLYFALSLSGHLFPDNEYAMPVAQFGDRSLRAIVVGAPMIGIMQVALGGDRPPDHSNWRPFRSSNGASPHAFVGAVPFLTAAYMVENRALKTMLVVGSTWSSWARIHNDENYFSQVLLGWSVAYLAAQTVAGTDLDANAVQIVPLPTSQGMGLGVQIRY